MTNLSNMSYTNKDFNSIYEELLEYAKKISYKWDPTISDESDPGVVLLKLAAIIGDKNSYNIDKNVLELMPSSVTQSNNARQLFEQCGYTMSYYKSAVGNIELFLKKDLGDDIEEDTDSDYLYTIPAFTMFSDAENSSTYSSTQPVTIQKNVQRSIPVIEGISMKYTVNNDPLITLQNLDSNYRIYFTETNIPENGIFISTVENGVDQENYDEWNRVDNIYVQPKGKPCYRFGLTDSNICYIEFPPDIEQLIHEGLHITYVLTKGVNGSVSAGKIRQLSIDTTIIRTDTLNNSSKQVSVTMEDISLKNSLPIINGSDPESIDSAYRSYQRVRNTFETLVTLKDYSDYMVTQKLASNGFVCDRTNDILRSYKVFNVDGNVQTTQSTTDDLEAFELCVYALQYVPSVTNTTAYLESFNMIDGKNIENYFNSSEVKSIQHDFKSLSPDKILMLKNKYPIYAKVIPTHKLTDLEKFQVISNIETALCQTLDATHMTFSEPVSVSQIQDVIINSDVRIKTLVDFRSLNYQTYAVYKDSNGEFKEIRIDDKSDDAGFQPVKLSVNTFTSKKATNHLYYKDHYGTFCHVPANDSAPQGIITTYRADFNYYVYDKDLHDLWVDFRAEIFAKNILAGVTPYYEFVDTFEVSLGYEKLNYISDIETIETSTTIPPNETTGSTQYTYSVQDNENIILTAPSYVEENNFSNYVKVIYKLHGYGDKGSPIPPNANYMLNKDKDKQDFIIFLWKTSDADENYTYVKYSGGEESLATHINPSYQMMKQEIDENILAYFSSKPDGKSTTSSGASIGSTGLTETAFVKSLTSTAKGEVLTGTQIIRTKKKATELIAPTTSSGYKKVYWILNNAVENKYNLFDSCNGGANVGEGYTEYTLKSGEYFMYTDESESMLYIKGEGTKITRNQSDLTWNVPVVSYDDILNKGIVSLKDSWFKVKAEDNLEYHEQQIIVLGPGAKLIHPCNTGDDNPGEITKEGLTLNGAWSYYVDDVTTTLPEQEGDDAWIATPILNLDVSLDKEQKLLNNQKLDVRYKDNKGETKLESFTECFIKSSEKIIHRGSKPLTNLSLDILGYDIKEDSTTDGIEQHMNKSTGEYIVHIPADKLNGPDKDGYYSKEFTIKISSLNDSEGIFKITSNSSFCIPIIDNKYTKSKAVLLTPQGEDTPVTWDQTFTVLVKTKESFDLVFYPIRCIKRTTSDGISIGNESGTFKTHLDTMINDLKDSSKVPAGSVSYEDIPDAIVNPLEADSFFNKRHFYNRYTIPQWTADVDNYISVYDIVN